MEKAETKKVNNRGALRFLAKRLKKQLPILILLSFMMAAVSALAVSMSLFMARAINAAVAGERALMMKNLITMVCVTVAGLSLRFVSKLIQTRMAFKMEMALRRSMLDGILSRDYAKVTAYHSGDLMNRLTNDISVVSSAASTMLPRLFELLARLGFAFGILLSIDWIFAVLSVGAAVIIAVLSLVLRPILKKLHRRVQETEGDTRAFMQETVENQLVIRVFGARERMLGRLDGLQERSFRAAMRRRLATVLSGEGLTFVFTLGTLGALLWGTLSLAGVFGPERVIDYGSLAAVLQLVSQVQTPFSALAGLVPQFFTMTASCERLMEIDSLGAEPGAEPSSELSSEQGSELSSKQGVLPAPLRGFDSAEIEGLSFGYNKEGSEVKVFDNASARICRGDFVAITGISGIGKSTLMKLLLGVYRPDGGSVAIVSGGRRIPASARTRELFAYVPQGNLLLSGSVRENIAFFNTEATDEEIMEAARLACADEFISKLPQGLSTAIGEHGLGLSEGQAQRIAVARAILRGAPVLLLDEATSALDAATEERLLKSLRGSSVETLVIITHKAAALGVCDKEIRIEGGRIGVIDLD